MPDPKTKRRLEEMIRLHGHCLEMTRAIITTRDWANPDLLDRFLNTRAEILTKVEDLATGLDLFDPSAPSPATSPPNKTKAASSDVLDRLRRVLTDLIQSDADLKTCLEGELSEIGGKLNRLSMGLRALKSYTGLRPVRPSAGFKADC